MSASWQQKLDLNMVVRIALQLAIKQFYCVPMPILKFSFFRISQGV